MNWPWTRDIQQLQQQVARLMATSAEHTAALTAINTQVGAISAAVANLKASIGQTTPEVDAALAALQASVNALATAAGA